MTLDVGDRVTGKTRLLSERCSTCIMRPAGERIPLTNERVREFVNAAVEAGSFVVCHSTLPTSGTGAEPAVCRGFADRYDTAALRLIRALWGFVEVAPPSAGEVA
jgi:hypothetical protein